MEVITYRYQFQRCFPYIICYPSGKTPFHLWIWKFAIGQGTEMGYLECLGFRCSSILWHYDVLKKAGFLILGWTKQKMKYKGKDLQIFHSLGDGLYKIIGLISDYKKSYIWIYCRCQLSWKHVPVLWHTEIVISTFHICYVSLKLLWTLQEDRSNIYNLVLSRIDYWKAAWAWTVCWLFGPAMRSHVLQLHRDPRLDAGLHSRLLYFIYRSYSRIRVF
jgi:hypothetical protein